MCLNAAKQVFDPVLRWAEGELGAQLVADDSLIGMDQSEQLINNARSYLHGQLAKRSRWCCLLAELRCCTMPDNSNALTRMVRKLRWLVVGAQG